MVKISQFGISEVLQFLVVLLQPFWWCCVDYVIHHERDVREEQKYICMA